MTEIITFIVLVVIWGGIAISDTRDRKARIAYHTEKLRECNMKGDKELADAHMKALVSAQSRRS